jgi:hypothetical protein
MAKVSRRLWRRETAITRAADDAESFLFVLVDLVHEVRAHEGGDTTAAVDRLEQLWRSENSLVRLLRLARSDGHTFPIIPSEGTPPP